MFPCCENVCKNDRSVNGRPCPAKIDVIENPNSKLGVGLKAMFAPQRKGWGSTLWIPSPNCSKLGPSRKYLVPPIRARNPDTVTGPGDATRLAIASGLLVPRVASAVPEHCWKAKYWCFGWLPTKGFVDRR